MRGSLRRRFFVLIFSFLSFFSLTSPVFADGMAFKKYLDRWDYVLEDNQEAYINYENGVEKMIVSVGLKEGDEDIVWLFPVPSAPEKVSIDVLTKLPKLKGEDVLEQARSSLENIRSNLTLTQVHFFLLGKVFFGIIPGTGGLFRPEGVTVYEHLEKSGITAEIITAKTGTDLYDYLREKGLNIEIESIPVLDFYVGKDYSFVTSWITPGATTSTIDQRGLFVTFPTEKIYYPLYPTSVYGKEIIPIVIRIMGHVTPEIYNGIKKQTKIKYFVGEFENLEKELGGFYLGNRKNLEYTRISINSPSSLLTNDLWVSQEVPPEIPRAFWVMKYQVPITLALLFCCSFVTGLISGWIMFKESRSLKGILNFGLLGLFNCFSIIGLAAAVFLKKTKPVTPDVIGILEDVKEKGYIRKRRLVLVFLCLVPLTIIGSLYLALVVVETNIFLLVPFFLFVFALWFERIDKNDRPLFEQLKSKEYSTFTFLPEDRRKIDFLVLYSALFMLIVSWVIYEIGFIMGRGEGVSEWEQVGDLISVSFWFFITFCVLLAHWLHRKLFPQKK